MEEEFSELLNSSIPGKQQPQNQSLVSATGNRTDLGEKDWQTTKRYLTDSMEYLLNSQVACDVTFIVGPDFDQQKLRAHKLILLSRSAVFQTMFSEDWVDDKPIEVPDVEPAAFKEMLRFLYTDTLNITLDTIIPVIYAAKKYDIFGLLEECSDFLARQVCPDSAFNILIQARFYNLKTAVQACLKVIADNTKETLQTDDFLNIDVETLILILQRSDLRILETDLFDAVMRWSESACTSEKLPVNPEHQRAVLKDALRFVRFPLMTSEEFTSKVLNTGVLSEPEIISALLHFVPKDVSIASMFSSKPRKPFLVVSRFLNTTEGSYSSGTHTIAFEVNSKTCLLGFGLYGSPNQRNSYNISFSLKTLSASDGSSVTFYTEDTKTFICSSRRIFRVLFTIPATLLANVKYLLEVKIEGEYFLAGTNGMTSVTMDTRQNEKITIQLPNRCNYSRSGGYTDFNSGQIPELLFEW